MKILKNKGVVYNEKSCNLLQGNRYEYNKKDRKYGPVSNDTGFFDAFVLEDYEIDAKEIAKQINLGPALSVKEDINYVNRYILNTTHIYPVGSSCPSHQTAIIIGSPTVIVNGKGLARVGALYTGGEAVATGSPDVFAG